MLSGNNLKKVGFTTAITLVIANMIGSGVFTSLGFQALDIKSVFPLLMLWLLGGIVALCGSLSYGELAALMPRSGGEYHFLTKIYHPAVGFLAGWVSATVGFAAPIALAANAFSDYFIKILPITKDFWIPQEILIKIGAVLIILIISLIHSSNIKTGSIFQRYATFIKIGLIIFFILSGLFIAPDTQPITVLPKDGDFDLVFSAPFAISLAYVSFSYSGWNASAYITNEIENPQRNVPRSLFLGTLLVTFLYVLINLIFLYTAPIADMAGKTDVAYIPAQNIFGMVGGKVMSMTIALLLVSSMSAMIFAGPRVAQVMGEDIYILKFLAKRDHKSIPKNALWLQSSISILLVLTSSFDQILNYIAFTLDIFTLLTVLGVFVMRYKMPKAERTYKTWGYPITPLLFLVSTGWTMFFLLIKRRDESLIALGVVLFGLVLYFIDQNLRKRVKAIS